MTPACWPCVVTTCVTVTMTRVSRACDTYRTLVAGGGGGLVWGTSSLMSHALGRAGRGATKWAGLISR